MRKWLIGLAALGGASLIALAGRALSRRGKVSRIHQILEHAGTFLESIERGRLEGVTNSTQLAPQQGGWIDTYEGRIDGQDFKFETLVPGNLGEIDESGGQRAYLLIWDGKAVHVVITPDPDNEDPHVFDRIHRYLRRHERFGNGVRPS